MFSESDQHKGYDFNWTSNGGTSFHSRCVLIFFFSSDSTQVLNLVALRH